MVLPLNSEMVTRRAFEISQYVLPSSSVCGVVERREEEPVPVPVMLGLLRLEDCAGGGDEGEFEVSVKC